jgi:hypothetical protein
MRGLTTLRCRDRDWIVQELRGASDGVFACGAHGIDTLRIVPLGGAVRWRRSWCPHKPQPLV